MADQQTQRHRMVDRLQRSGIADERVLTAMRAVPREQFVPAQRGPVAYEDEPVSIGDGQTASAPWIVAAMTAALALSGTERVLEVGAGRGYAAAVLAQCCAAVVTVERQPDLAASARTNLDAAGCDNVDLRIGDGSAGVPDAAPFDAISVTAMAQREPPPALLSQLTTNGVLVCPVGSGERGSLLRYQHGNTENLAAVGFVPLVSDEP